MLIHADADAFFASVEERDDPTLRGVPFVVAHQVVACPSYPARRLGIRGGAPVAHALRICPGLRVVEPRFEAYERAGVGLFDLFRGVTTFVEPGSMEEAFLDVEVVGLDPVTTARELRARAREEIGLPVSMGVGTTKLMAKVASRRAKPDGMLVISRREDRAVRHALTLEEVWGLGPSTVLALREQGWLTVGDLADVEVHQLVPVVGTMVARRVAAVAAGLDDARIKVPGARRSAGATRTIAPTRTAGIVEGLLDRLVADAWGRVTGDARLREGSSLETFRMVLTLRYDDLVVLERRVDLSPAARDADDLVRHARHLLAATRWTDDGRGVSFVGIGLHCRPPRVSPDQLEMF